MTKRVETMLKLVARALEPDVFRKHEGIYAYYLSTGDDEETAQECADIMHPLEPALAKARAAIEAMREPTDLMRLGLPSDYRPGTHSATGIYRAMIDAALAEGE